MKRNKNGILVFDSEEERLAYEAKKETFLSRTEEQNISMYDDEINKAYRAAAEAEI